ncbi:flagellar FLiS export co-chaperone [Helicobacter sp. MIT 21-1697]|uniref:flagellar FLiS export co-chaperone n=1 Tax=Helicobacter sp. MIT 21-1697 TaxID=2993733 RepID=UPI00224AF8E5|nr:flagellar FLiS export co-chaperone [Helicobacter sp. MIT 21-1697]MCX2716280.1 flagellar FLiS export co-chaperone [Helicobacter sp. MIT 21-1697]
MQDILSTLHRHINTQFTEEMGQSIPMPSAKAIHRFSEDIKGANEFIGALQSASVALKKILKLAQSVDIQSQEIQIAQVKSAMQEIIDNTSFMGVKLFGTQLHTHLHTKTYTITIENPMPLCEGTSHTSSCANPSMDTLISYVEEKANEITQMLLDLSEALSEPTNAKQENSYNFEEFNPQAFAQMFKGR